MADDSQSEAAMGATGITNPAADVLELGDIAAGGEEEPAQSRRPEHPSVRNIGVYNAPGQFCQDWFQSQYCELIFVPETLYLDLTILYYKLLTPHCWHYLMDVISPLATNC